ncbi:hypothetical protein EMIHUDRAFT_48894, partial [Emiliania huxleyi CCMP1516]|uniref:Uncharacterized protein n=2 Tax=Emiliania huxleyi TaxID=2903 RepID=A0A0D3KCY3_EMIH1
EHLVNEQLKSDLQQVLERRDALYERIAHCLELRNNMTMLLDEQLHSLKTKVNLGCDFYVDASIPDTSWVYVSVGLGFHAQ